MFNIGEGIISQRINIAQVTFSVFETVRKVERKDIFLEADFQRNFKWKNEKKSKLIESIILDIPIQAIYLSEESDGKYEIIDGQQRVRTIYEFVNNKFSMNKTKFFGEKRYFKDLDISVQRKIEDFQLVVFIVKKDNNPEVKFEIFERINTGAVKLNSQELRNCIYRNKGIPFIKELVKEKEFIRLIKNTNVNINSMQDQELALRFMSFYLKGIDSYTGNLKRFLNNTLDEYDIYREREEEIKYAFKNAARNVYDVFGDEAFVISTKKKVGKRKINIALFDLHMITLSKYSNCVVNNCKEEIIRNFNKIINNNDEFRSCILGASNNNKIKTKKRFNIWNECIKYILEENND
ncbi:DUF262 domain-containing protein [Clostridium perfringens]|uniref:DUF262 domain-containing protein n=1 Tax=Clostridium perfringens TaxID=1502 RepID=A0A8H9QZY7_CLOPF|nr:DUF262 domain-containing protein [Clostridium perfringens]HAT4308262.1 DUF262 domain-containing protein [Clostridium perfringens]